MANRFLDNTGRPNVTLLLEGNILLGLWDRQVTRDSSRMKPT